MADGSPTERREPVRHIALTSHPRRGRPKPPKVVWGAAEAAARGPVIGTLSDSGRRNVIGAHSGAYALYRALAVAAGSLDALHRPDLTDTAPAEPIGPHPQWADPAKIVSLDPLGHVVGAAFADQLAEGWDIRPTIAVTKARLTVPELRDGVSAGTLEADGRIVVASGEVNCTKVAFEPVWYLPGVAERCGISETELRRHLFEQTGGMFPELVTRNDLKVFLPRSAVRPPISLVTWTRSPIPSGRWPAGSTTSATAPTCSAPISAPAGPIWSTGSRSASPRPRPAAPG